MSFWSHLKEIVRQGIWASLTGGWYYEPSYSIFCNTVHLYIWLLLFILPLVLGLLCTEESSVVVIGIYTGIITLLFLCLKFIVLYLHNLFDTSDPIYVTSKKSSKQSDNSSKVVSHGTGGSEVLNEEDIEMVEFKENYGNDESDAQQTPENIPSLPSRRSVRIDGILRTKLGESEDHSEQKTENEWGNDNIEHKSDVGHLPPALPILLPTDSLELIPMSRRSELTQSRSQSAIVRKLSEPCLESNYRGWSKAPRFLSKENESHVRRAKSFFESTSRVSTRSGTFLSQRTLEECKKATRKSFPSKMSNASFFLSDALAARETTSQSELTGFDNTPHRHSQENDEKRRCISSDNSSCAGIASNEASTQQAVNYDHILPFVDKELPSTSGVKTRQAKNVDFDQEEEDGHDLSTAGSPSSDAWSPFFMSSVEVDRPSTSVLHRTSEKVGASRRREGNSSDLKGEITKFLEDLVDMHPETLEAMENVRLNRLGRNHNSSLGLSQPSTSRLRASDHGATSVAVLSDLASKDGTHVAVDHEDTSQGAIHCFQDEDGNWWTYAFDSKGVGTAHAINFGKLLEAVHFKRKIVPDKHNSSPSDVSDGSMICDSDCEPVTLFQRLDSSSSAESDPYIAEKPCNAFCAAGAASLTRHFGHSSGKTAENGRFACDSDCDSLCNNLDANSGPSSVTRISDSTLMGKEINTGRIVSLTNSGSSHRHGASSSYRHGRSISARTENFDGDSFINRQSAMLMSGGQASRVPRRTGALRITRLASRHESILPSTLRLAFLSDSVSVTSGGMVGSTQRTTSNKKTYYRLKMFSSSKFNGVKIQMDRLSVAALFDRNNSLFSSIFDVFFAALVSTLAGILLSRAIFYDYSLFMFAVVVAGAQSVQPDAASPIHGFNWLAAYSRPTFFCIYGLILLIVDTICRRCADETHEIGWLWSPYRPNVSLFASAMFFARDLFIMLLLFLPFAFTIGLYPQVNTLLLHVLEQIEMHFFGGTACFSLLSAFLQLSKSLLSFGFLGSLAYVAYSADSNATHNVLFALFTAAAASLSWLLSRWSSNPAMMTIGFRSVINYSSLPFCSNTSHCDAEASHVLNKADGDRNAQPPLTLDDPLPSVLKAVLSRRIRMDLFTGVFTFLLLFALHCSSVFHVTQPTLQICLCGLCIFFGVCNHYLYNQMRKAFPWKFIAKPLLRSHEYSLFESAAAAKLMPFEVVHFCCLIIEKSILYPLLVVSTVSINNWSLPPWFLALFAIRILRTAFCQPQVLYIPLVFSCLLLYADLSSFDKIENYFPLIFYVTTALWPKVIEFYLKMSFITIYTAPWQISWGSAFHAFAQPFSLPHTALVIFQAVFSSVISAPLNPFLGNLQKILFNPFEGSSFVLMSYVRPVKFWEKDYNTKRIDHSNTRLISQINRGPMLDDSNLNAVFYEHLTRSLQASLAGDLVLGRWSTSVSPGDCFILASYYLNCMVHIIEVGNGYVTFQVRGLEFRGTYCHQREVEAITEDVNDGNGCFCCSCGPLPGILSFNTAWLLRWLSWEIVTTKYIIDGYSITDNSAVSLLQVHDLRRLLVTLYVKCIIYYALSSSKLGEWLRTPAVQTALSAIEVRSSYADVDPAFCAANDEDFDINQKGVSRHHFMILYDSWIRHCMQQRDFPKDAIDVEERGSRRVSVFCYALSLVGRRALASAAHNRHANAAESFLYGLHALFKGDFRITSQRDEWVFVDMDLLRNVLAPAVRMALKLHQDHFAAGDDLDDPTLLYNRIKEHLPRLFISHEDDPDWRRAIIANTPSLLALRHMYDDGQDDYKIIMLNRMHLDLRVIKLNKECVRAFWAGQQQELIFLRNRNPERGSIQNARQVLRNMINSSADQPIGYPIYVSPLTTSYVDTHPQFQKIIGPSFNFESFSQRLRSLWFSIRSRLGTSGSTNLQMTNQGHSPGLWTGVQFIAEGNERSSVPNPEVHLQNLRNTLPSVSAISQRSGDGVGSSALVLEDSVVAMSSDGTPKVTLCRRVGGRYDSFLQIPEKFSCYSCSKLHAKITQAEEFSMKDVSGFYVPVGKSGLPMISQKDYEQDVIENGSMMNAVNGDHS